MLRSIYVSLRSESTQRHVGQLGHLRLRKTSLESCSVTCTIIGSKPNSIARSRVRDAACRRCSSACPDDTVTALAVNMPSTAIYPAHKHPISTIKPNANTSLRVLIVLIG